jgi:hypothetical protein
MRELKRIAVEATESINGVLDQPLGDEQAEKVASIIEAAVIKAVLEGQHRAVDACLECPEAEQDIAHKVATAIRRKNDALIANLSSLR